MFGSFLAALTLLAVPASWISWHALFHHSSVEISFGVGDSFWVELIAAILGVLCVWCMSLPETGRPRERGSARKMLWGLALIGFGADLLLSASSNIATNRYVAMIAALFSVSALLICAVFVAQRCRSLLNRIPATGTAAFGLISIVLAAVGGAFTLTGWVGVFAANRTHKIDIFRTNEIGVPFVLLGGFGGILLAAGYFMMLLFFIRSGLWYRQVMRFSDEAPCDRENAQGTGRPASPTGGEVTNSTGPHAECEDEELAPDQSPQRPGGWSGLE